MENTINFSLEDYLLSTGCEKNKFGSVWRKSNKSLRVYKNGLMIALNNNIDVKHRHIVTCELPNSFDEAEIVFNKCRLNHKNLKK